MNISASLLFILFCLQCQGAFGQNTGFVRGRWNTDNVVRNPSSLQISCNAKNFRVIHTDSNSFSFSAEKGLSKVTFSAEGYLSEKINIDVQDTTNVDVLLKADIELIQEVTITGNISETQKSGSAVIVDVIKSSYLKKNKSATLFENLGLVTGVRPQINCSVCNTGDIHINGMEGPYTMVLIDGLPVMSSLGSVYGLVGIPSSMVERIEIIKGPAASLYGSESMGGTINIITKNAADSKKLLIEYLTSSWSEQNLDIAASRMNRKFSILGSGNLFYYQKKRDDNFDNFTDLALQFRASAFMKLSGNNKKWELAARGVYENRWGGDMRWEPKFAGTDSVYGENIATKRGEIMGKNLLFGDRKIVLQYAANYHAQNSYYGTQRFDAVQALGFGQLYKIFKLNQQSNLMAGMAYRYIFYDDNTAATSTIKDKSNPNLHTHLPGIFLQNETQKGRVNFILGYRADWHQNHGIIHSPRLAVKLQLNKQHALRINAGEGFRVVNLFTEEHAALTGSREVVIAEQLMPERSRNATLNYSFEKNRRKVFFKTDISAFYTHFSNQIIGDYTTNQNLIIFKNLNGYAMARGASANISLYFIGALKINAGISYSKAMFRQDGVTQLQMFAPIWSGNGTITYTFRKINTRIDATFVWNGPMRLPILPNDFRPEFSPWHVIGNLQATKTFANDCEIFAGVKNLFNFIPQNPVMRPHDPFDKKANDPIDNPNGYTFDASYNYASLQGIRAIAGIKIGF